MEPDETLIRPIAAKLANRYRGIVDREDVAQELRIWWLTHEKAVNKYAHAEEDKRGVESWNLRRKLYRAGDRYCRTVKGQALGYLPEDEAFYDRELIRDLLPMVWNPELILQSNPNEGQQKVRGSRSPAEGNNLPVMVADVSRAVDELSEADRYILFLHYGQGAEVREIADLENLTLASVKMRTQRALKRLVDFLGGESPWSDGPGSRRVMSNAQAQAITAHQEGG